MRVEGLETSSYAILNSMPEIKKNIKYCNNYTNFNYKDKEFDFIIGLGVVYTHSLPDAIKCLKEIQRIGKGKSFITLRAYEDEKDRKLFSYWTLLGNTLLRKDDWLEVLKHSGYTGDFKFNTARLINHSCEPNCEVDGKGLKLWIYSLRNIKKGEELSYDYGFSFDEDYRQFPCKCGSKSCCGYIVREGSRWRIKKRKKRK